MEDRMYYMLKELLMENGYTKTANDPTYLKAVLEYLDTMCPPDYTLKDWLRDTEWNYPEDLK